MLGEVTTSVGVVGCHWW